MHRPFTEEQNEWIRENYRNYGKHHIADAFNQKFNDNRTMQTLWSKVRRMGLTGNGAEYKRQMCIKHFSVPIGTEYVDAQGYTLVKVKDDKGGKSKNWETKQRVVWKEHYGDIPKGHFILFLNNDITDFRIENLVCVPRGIIATLAKKGWHSTENELKKLAIDWCRLYRATDIDGMSSVCADYEDEALCVYGEVR